MSPHPSFRPRHRALLVAVSAVSLLMAGVGPSVAATALPAAASAAISFGIPPAPKTTEISKTTIGLAWNPIPGAPNYRIQLSGNADMSGATYLRTTATSYEVRNLEPDKAYYFKIRAIESDADGGGGLSDYSEAVSAKTRPTPVMSPLTQPLKVSSFNLTCANCFDSDSGADQLPWAGRRDTVVAQVKAKRPDVIGFQEIAQSWLFDANGSQINLSQFEDLQQRLAAAGTTYKLTNSNRNNCENSYTPTNCVWKDQGASQGTRVMYNADTVDMISQGSERLPYIDEADNQRYVAWGVFRQKSSGKSFFFADTHIEPSSHTPEYMDLKIKQAQRIAGLIKEKNTAKLPVIIVGDMNSSKYMVPSNGPWDVFTGAGYIDPLGNDYGSTFPSGKATAEKRINAEYNSFNGYVRKLSKNNTVGSNGRHLDYIFTSPMRFAEWEMVLNKDSADNQIGIIPSDHNMILGTVELPAVAPQASVETTPISALAATTPSLGAATGTVISGLRDGGSSQSFLGGDVHWSKASGAHVTKGGIRTTWRANGAENGQLGYPTGEETGGLRNGGVIQFFQGGAIVWSPAAGSQVSMGGIRTTWLQNGAENGQLGYPTSKEITGLRNGGVIQYYQGGAIIWSPATGSQVSMGAIRTAWAGTGYENGRLGYPTSREYPTGGGAVAQDYQRGRITWTPGRGASVS